MSLQQNSSLPRSVENFLCQAHVEFDLVRHPHSSSALSSAREAHIDHSQVVKSVILSDVVTGVYHMVLLQADHEVDITRINETFGKTMRLATEQEVTDLFSDCEHGAVPGFSQAYNIPAIRDDRLDELKDLYLESGNHEVLIHLDHAQFRDLTGEGAHGDISRSLHVDSIGYQLGHMKRRFHPF